MREALSSARVHGLSSSRAFGHGHAAELGAVWVDLGYLEHLGAQIVRHLAGMQPKANAWSKREHDETPVAFLRSIVARARHLGNGDRDLRDEARAFAVGLASHIVVDRIVHPLVNSLAYDDPSRHNEIEKMHNAAFHERYFHCDVIGTMTYADLAAVDLARGLARRPLVERVVGPAMNDAFGDAPSTREITAWSRGYQAYVAIFASPLGRVAAWQRKRDEICEDVCACVDEAVEAAVRESVRVIEAVGELEDPASLVPEGTIDPPAAAFTGEFRL